MLNGRARCAFDSLGDLSPDSFSPDALFGALMKSRLTLSLALAAALLAPSAFAASSCDAQALEKKLAGAAKTSFLKKCEADAAAAAPAAPALVAPKACEAQAAEKKLAGAAKASFLKKCETDAQAGSAKAECETKAGEKKLAGAAKASFLKKCEADAAKK
jgi:hypothetical protein